MLKIFEIKFKFDFLVIKSFILLIIVLNLKNHYF